MYFNVFMLYEHISYDNVPDLVICYNSYVCTWNRHQAFTSNAKQTLHATRIAMDVASLTVHILASTHIQPFIP